MAKTLILVRHGKAQPRSNDRLDEARELTAAGRRALAAHLPRAFALANAEELESAQVWVSPALRTRQTGDIIAKAIGVDVPIALQSLLDQDERAFLVQVARSSAEHIFAVGHNPFIERVAERLCGSRIVFAPGAIAALSLRDDMLDRIATSDSFDPSARLQWFVQGPQAKRFQTLVDLETELAGWMSRVEERLAAFLRDPDDVERLHRLRVAVRTLRSLVAFAGPYMKGRQRDMVQENLRDVVALTSRQRDRDVLCEQIALMDVQADELLAAATKLRDEKRAGVVRKLSGDKVAKTMFRTGRAVRDVSWRASFVREGIAPEDLRARFFDLFDEVSDAVGDIDTADMESVHDLRKKAKRVRYVAENLGPAFGVDAAPVAAAMEEVQEKLGALCDAHVGMLACDRFPREGLVPEAVFALGVLRDRFARELGIEDSSAGGAGGTLDADDAGDKQDKDDRLEPSRPNESGISVDASNLECMATCE